MDIGKLFIAVLYWCATVRTSSSSKRELQHLNRMSEDLQDVPFGGYHVVSLNVAYNNITYLSSYIFFLNKYKNLNLIELGHNKMSEIHVDAFREMRSLECVDLSSNNLTELEANTFRHNTRLHKLDVTSNQLSFDPEKPFLRSYSLEVLVMSQNHITHIFDITFARIQNLRQLLLDDNPIYYMSRNCFAYSTRLQYISLARSGVHTIGEDMFRTPPRLVDLSGTPLAQKFNPPLTRVRSTQLIKLINIEKFDGMMESDS
ncbi:leucine-rich repeat-containing protein 15-like [Sitophilus oryzae]|uniref:Leucine-rich repeat-containing protein 15-like n=1 Tax=Sitophilus oryzae TaxID=7048 RepID=A0A6J2Y1J4_SITOR|nr:leucine-rich repeat-containing protein 15-like [Sitophilus oryzae]